MWVIRRKKTCEKWYMFVPRILQLIHWIGLGTNSVKMSRLVPGLSQRWEGRIGPNLGLIYWSTGPIPRAKIQSLSEWQEHLSGAPQLGGQDQDQPPGSGSVSRNALRCLRSQDDLTHTHLLPGNVLDLVNTTNKSHFLGGNAARKLGFQEQFLWPYVSRIGIF